ncbi:PIG-L family deacetylase [Mycobacterium sp. 1274756.6]|uniref:PIG-L deacetylase family protein n=1 Tax=Mycobacterium sp. 1274756.6 TaxID=1834076 RepID=UPI0007FDB9FB|nr:PIG-L family deacetylase [Mycobacterium sp. 1274756.6]OBJ69280.1 GlcNAc-PI de-N-acetylase [Mycobacterium sp. 1274756.6]
MSTIEPFPTDWQSALVLVPHPDDPEYGLAAAVAKWTTAGRTVRYELACRGEAGIEGMPPEQAGPIREGEQRRSAAIVGVDHVEFWDFPDSAIRNTAALRDRIADRISALRPDVVLSIYGGGEWGPGMPNQRDHMEFAAAVTEAFDLLADPPRWLFQFGPDPTHIETVDDYLEVAVDALAAHEKYLSVLDPDTPVRDQAAAVIEMTVGTAPQTGARVVGFIHLRGPA